MNYKKISALLFLPIFFILFIISFQSCSDNSLAPLVPVVSGQVQNSNGNPVPNIIVRIGDQSAITNINGTYSFRNVTMPYDLLIIDEQARSQQLVKSINRRIAIIPEFLTSYNSTNKATITVTIPAVLIPSGKKGKLIYTDGNSINSTVDIRNENTVLEVDLKENILAKGKIIILIYSTDNTGKITSYDNYGERNGVELIPGSRQSIDFDQSELSFDPAEKNITGTINVPSGFNSSTNYFFLNFAASSNLFNDPDVKYSDIDGNNFSINIPENLPSEFSFFINSYITDLSNDKYCLETFKIQNNTNNLILQSNLPAELISPVNNATEVNLNSEISYTEGGGPGVYISRFINDGHVYSVVTDKNSFLLSELNKFEMGNINNENFVWSVQKLGEVLNLDEFLTYFPKNTDRFISKSEQWSFQTAP